MAIVLGANQYGKAENRVVRIVRDTPRHEIRDLNVSTSLRGDFADAHATGDQAHVLPTDTQKNTAFAYAKMHGVASAEDYALALGRPAARGRPGGERARRYGSRSTPGTGSRRADGRARPRVRTPRRRDPHLRGHRRPRGDDPRAVRAAGPGACSSRPARSSRASSRTSSPPWPRPTTGCWRRRWSPRWRHSERPTVDWNASYDRRARAAARDVRHDVLPRAPGDAAR